MFSKYHETVLYSNYQMNKQKIQSNDLYNIKNSLVKCYGYPLKIDGKNCNELVNFNYEVNILYNGVCENKKILKNKESLNSYKNLVIPIIDNDTSYICIGEIKNYNG